MRELEAYAGDPSNIVMSGKLIKSPSWLEILNAKPLSD